MIAIVELAPCVRAHRAEIPRSSNCHASTPAHDVGPRKHGSFGSVARSVAWNATSGSTAITPGDCWSALIDARSACRLTTVGAMRSPSTRLAACSVVNVTTTSVGLAASAGVARNSGTAITNAANSAAYPRTRIPFTNILLILTRPYCRQCYRRGEKKGCAWVTISDALRARYDAARHVPSPSARREPVRPRTKAPE